MLYYLNNCKNLRHAMIYGGSAIFDLWAEGFEDNRARAMAPGDTCLVASRAGNGRIEFAWYQFTKNRLLSASVTQPKAVWVIEGSLERSETLPRQAAIQHANYSRFFNKKGHFNQWSVLRDACPV